jgi:hypothetical protein
MTPALGDGALTSTEPVVLVDPVRAAWVRRPRLAFPRLSRVVTGTVAAALVLSLAPVGPGAPAATAARTRAPRILTLDLLVQDNFGRTVTGGFGSARVGGRYSVSGSASDFRVEGGLGRMRTPAGSSRSALLSPTAVSTSSAVSFRLDRLPEGGSAWLYLASRRGSDGTEYRARVRIDGTSAVFLSVSRTGAREVQLGSEVRTSLALIAGQPMRVRFTVTGGSPTRLRLRAWPATATEPTTWAIDRSDSTTALQDAGAPGIRTYVSGSTLNGPVEVAVDDYSVRQLDTSVAGGAARQLALGVSRHPDNGLVALDDVIARHGRVPATWSLWSSWGMDSAPFPDRALLNGIVARGSVPMIFWQPVGPDLEDPRFTYERIIAGDFDAYVRQWAQDAKAWGKRVLVRFAFEMNGKWFPWGVGRFDNTAEGFVAAWRHIHTIVRAEVGANNVRFVWSPYSPVGCGGGCASYASIWPGDGYVDYAGFSTFDWNANASMVDMFRPAVQAITAITGKPIIVPETGTPAGDHKPSWLWDGYQAVHAAFPRIKAIVYFDVRASGQRDWRLTSPRDAEVVYASLLANQRFQGVIP